MSQPPITDVLRALVEALQSAGLRWYIFGAQAVLVHGLPQQTADIDVTIDPAERGTLDILALLDRVDIRPRTSMFLEQARLLPLVHAPTGMAVDVVLAGEGIEEDFLARAVQVDLSGVVVPVLSVEDLIATKVVAGRRQDRQDILGILQQGRAIDLVRLRATLAAFDAGLDGPRATETFDRIHNSFVRPKRTR
ncbi:MAG: DUF6036 family nucleotidyltransferase [Polyangiaceae bacterium]